MRKVTLFVFVFIFGFFSCKKNKIGNISGVVINKTTQKPVNGIHVILKATKDSRGGVPFGRTLWGKYSAKMMEAVTDANGNFNFENFEIDSKARYELFTSSYAGLHNGRSHYGDAMPMNVDAYNSTKVHQLEVTPLMDYLWVQLNKNTLIISPDSVSINFTHKYFYNKQPISNVLTTYFLKGGFKAYALQQDVMGQWYITIYKFKWGNSYTVRDSVFLNYGDTLTYKLNF